MSTTVLLWSTMIGYILSLDVLPGFPHSMYHWLNKCNLKKKRQQQTANSATTEEELSTTRRKTKETKLSLYKKSLFSTTGNLSNHVVNKYVTIFLHVIFFVLSIIIVLFGKTQFTDFSPSGADNYSFSDSPQSQNNQLYSSNYTTTASNVSIKVRYSTPNMV